MPALLIVAHAPSDNTRKLANAVLRGARHPDIDNVSVTWIEPLEATADDVLAADGIILGTTENLGYMSGALKDFFDRVYYPCLEKTDALPFALYIRAGHDGTGTRRAVQSITGGLRWKPICEPLICRGAFEEAFERDC
ncbi:flavodoxin family protein [Salinisphaera aquimarina]|uniref:Flavodoxin family protein n=1 Tax=Salinisphaera aquimarina TaxID=2094031 RepID=A0ABV7EJW3_9GAMM